MKRVTFACDDAHGLDANMSGHFGRCPLGKAQNLHITSQLCPNFQEHYSRVTIKEYLPGGANREHVW